MKPEVDDRKERLEQARELPAFFPALGITVEEIGEARVVVRMDVPDHFYTPYGAIHGGVVAAVIDTVGGMVVAMKLGPADRTATHSLNVSYTSFVRERSCRCIGRLLAMARSTATVELEVVREDGTLAAKALGTFGIYRNKNR
ncbi:MAG: PaaI family thioesterase [Candidatus Binatia bacterium]